MSTSSFRNRSVPNSSTKMSYTGTGSTGPQHTVTADTYNRGAGGGAVAPTVSSSTSTSSDRTYDAEDDEEDEDAITIKRSHSGENRSGKNSNKNHRTTVDVDRRRRRSSDPNATNRDAYAHYNRKNHSSQYSNTAFDFPENRHPQQQPQQHHSSTSASASASYQYQMWQYQQQMALFQNNSNKKNKNNHNHNTHSSGGNALPLPDTNVSSPYPLYQQNHPNYRNQSFPPPHLVYPAATVDGRQRYRYQHQEQQQPPQLSTHSPNQQQQQPIDPKQNTHASQKHQQARGLYSTFPSTATANASSNTSRVTTRNSETDQTVFAALLKGAGQSSLSPSYGSVKPEEPTVSSRPSSLQQTHPPQGLPGNSTNTTNNNISSRPASRLPPSRSNSIGSPKNSRSPYTPSNMVASPSHHMQPPPQQTAAHRRVNSDGTRPLEPPLHSNRSTSNGRAKQLPQPVLRKRLEGASSQQQIGNHFTFNRQRASSETQPSVGGLNYSNMGRPPTASPGGSVVGAESRIAGGHHRRSSSAASVGAASFMSEASMTSIVSNIRKSVFFEGVVHEITGKAQLHFPLCHVHLITIPSSPSGNTTTASPPISASTQPCYNSISNAPIETTEGGYPLQLGSLYQVGVDDNEYEEYHRVAENATEYQLDDDDMSQDLFLGGCPQCGRSGTSTTAQFQNHQKVGGGILPDNYFCLTVDDTIYCRVLDDICASRQMPFGLFFCGHHEDVSRPSIVIAVGLLTLIFGAMALVALFF